MRYVCTRSDVFVYFFQLQDTPGMDEVTLVRKFGNEEYVHHHNVASHDID